jgi:hypothetical protein
MANLVAYAVGNVAAEGGSVVMLTITAPGEDFGLTWDPGMCSLRHRHTHSGPNGCRVLKAAADAYNRAAPGLYSRAHKVAWQAVYRECGPGALHRLAVVPELQKRGVIHWHIVLAFTTPRERRAARRYAAHLTRIAARSGLGYVDRKALNARAKDKAGFPTIAAMTYLTKYLVKDVRGGLGEMIRAGVAPERAVYISPRLTATTRCTTRNLRRRRALWVATRMTVSLQETEALVGLCSRFGMPLSALSDGAPNLAGGTPP